jgi:hypothetical protein
MEHCLCWRQDAALTGTPGSMPPPRGGSHRGGRSMRLPAAYSHGGYNPGHLRFFLPLLVAVSEILFLRNYFGHHPGRSCHFLLRG